MVLVFRSRMETKVLVIFVKEGFSKVWDKEK